MMPKRNANPVQRVFPLFLALLALVYATACSMENSASNSASGVVPSGLPTQQALPKKPLPTLQCLYYERELFLSGVSAAGGYHVDGALAGGLVPHHLLASDMIAGFFEVAAGQAGLYDTVVLLSPAHFAPPGGKVITARAGWDTPYGKLEADTALLDAFPTAENSPNVVEYDHGVAGLVPFVKYYLPNVKIAPFLLPGTLPQAQVDSFNAALADVCAKGRILVVASVDCSHYLKPAEATRHDEATALAIEQRDYDAIARFTDSNIDSPKALAALLKMADGLGAEVLQLGHSSSAEKLPYAQSSQQFSDGITTYFVYAVVAGQPP